MPKQQIVPNTHEVPYIQPDESENPIEIGQNMNTEQMMKPEILSEQKFANEMEILETSEHKDTLKYEKINMTLSDICQLSKYSEDYELPNIHTKKTPEAVSRLEVSRVEEVSEEPVTDGEVQPIQQVLEAPIDAAEVEDENSNRTNVVKDGGMPGDTKIEDVGEYPDDTNDTLGIGGEGSDSARHVVEVEEE